jgi:Fungal protein of unknown function (DUF1752)
VDNDPSPVKGIASDTLPVYTLNSNHIDDDEGARLENLFWRIWSNENIIRSIRGNTLARLFITISEGGNRVRTTPVPSPLGTTPTQSVVCSFPEAEGARSLTSQTFPTALAHQVNATHVLPAKTEQSAGSPSAADIGASPRKSSDQARSLPPILKKSRTGSDGPPKSARISPPDAERQGSAGTAARRESLDSAGALSPSSGPTEKGLKNSAKKKPSFAAAAGTRKARPGAMRKRSSQSSASGEQKKNSQTSPSPRLPPPKTTPKPATGLPPLCKSGCLRLCSSSSSTSFLC